MYEIFAELLKKSGLTISEAARRIGIAPSTITDWRAGRYTPKQEKMQKIANFFGVSMEYLMTGKQPEHESTTGEKYYFSDETAEAAQELFDDPDLHALFSMAKDSGPDNVRFVTEMLRRLKDTNPEG